MGFWSTLAKIGGAAAAIGGAAFTGGSTLAALPGILSAGGAVASGMASGAAKNRGEQADTNMQNAQLQTSQAAQAANNEIQRGQLALDRQAADRTTQSDAYLKALRSALAMNMGDAKFSRNGYSSPVANVTFAGGARPSALGMEGKAAAELLNRQAMLQLMDGNTHEEVKPYQAPAPAEMPKAGFWEKLAGPVGLGLTVAGNLSGARDNGAAPTPSARLRVPDPATFA